MIKLIVVGKIKESFINQGMDEYLKRLSAYDKIEITEVRDINHKDIEKNLKDEGELILKQIDANDYVITLEIKGKIIDSESFASLIDKIRTYENKKITFIIGGSNGLAKEVLTRSDFALSFSHFTFPHQLMRVILLEQLYRAFTILNHQEYHK